MKKNNFITCLLLISTIIGCKKNTLNNQLVTDPQIIAHLDSMLQSIGANSYVDLLTGKLEGNFSFFAHYYPYDANCASSSIPFRINTQLSGTVSIDTANRYTLVNAGDLYINNIKISPDPISFNYTIPVFSTNSIALEQIYGHQTSIKLTKDDKNILESNIYIPKNIIIKGIDCNTGMFPDNSLKEGYTIKWNADNMNSNGVIIRLIGKDANTIERNSYILVRDIGSYSFSSSDLNLYPKANNLLGIDITLMRGNFAILKGSDNRKYNFNFITTCGYYFKQ